MANVNIRVESVSDEEQQTGVPSQKKEGAGGAKTTATSIFVHQALNTGKQILNYGISNIGNFTGDYARQERVQELVGAIGDVTTIGVGFASGGWIGGLVAVLGVATKEVFNQVSIQVENRHQEIATNYLRELSGNSTKNGSRTGE